MSDTPNQQQQQQLPQPGYHSQQQLFYPPPPSYQYQGGWPQGWGYVHPQPQGPHATPIRPPRAVVAEPPRKKRALESSDDEDTAPQASAPTRGRGRGRVARGGHLWGWIRFGFYTSKPTFPSCHAHKKQDCANCYAWEEVKKNV